MHTQDIPRDQWPSFLKDFSRVHMGHPVRLWVFVPEAGLRREGADLPLVAIDTARPAPGVERVDLTIGDSPESHVTHHIRRPSAIQVATNHGGTETSLQIDSDDGSSTFLNLGQPTDTPTPAASA